MITFPSMNLIFNINPIAFRIFGIEIFWYSIFIVLGIAVGLIICKFSEKNSKIKFDNVYECIIVSILVGIIGARIYYVLFNIEYYFRNPIKIFAIRDGGLAIYGGLIAGGIYCIFYCKKKKISVLKLFDYLAPSIVIGQSIGRWGNFFNVECYGNNTNNFFRMGINTIANGYQEVHPTFLYESVATFIIFIILQIMQQRKRFDGQIFCIYLLLYSIVRTLIEGIRVDSLIFFNLRISQILSITIFVVSGIILLKKNIKHNLEASFENK